MPFSAISSWVKFFLFPIFHIVNNNRQQKLKVNFFSLFLFPPSRRRVFLFFFLMILFLNLSSDTSRAVWRWSFEKKIEVEKILFRFLNCEEQAHDRHSTREFRSENSCDFIVKIEDFQFFLTQKYFEHFKHRRWWWMITKQTY